MYYYPTYRKDSSLPKMVLGTAGLGGAWGVIDKEESIETILSALEGGISHIDTAPAYAQGEIIVGEAISLWKGPKPFISTKVGKMEGDALEGNLNNYDVEVMRKSVEKSCQRLRTSVLDLLFLHEPERVAPNQIEKVVDFLSELKEQGVVKALGFGGTPPQLYYPYIKKGIFDNVMGYNNLDLVNCSAIRTQIPFFRDQGLKLFQGSVLHMGLLGNRFDKYVAERPKWVTDQEIVNAQKAAKLAHYYDMKLSTLAHRFVLSIRELDYMVLGCRNMLQFKDTFSVCHQGPLPEDIFQEIIDKIIM